MVIVMEIKKKTKKEIVKLLLKNNELEDRDEEELLDLLVDQPISIDVDKQEDEKMTFGDHMADKVSEIAGSWGFILGFSLFLLLWVVINGILLAQGSQIDPYPFILLNLLLSCLASLQAPIIMMSQNRQAKKDSIRNQNDYQIDLKSELILERLHDEVRECIKTQKQILRILESEKKKKK